MSEYQSYTFSTVDRSLTTAERNEIFRLSSHIDVSATGAFVEYHYGDFKHKPLDVLRRFFDVYLYEANWGQQTIAFRFDADEVPLHALQPFAAGSIEVFEHGDSVLIEASFDENFGESGWADESTVPDAECIDLYKAIKRGDYRSLLLMLIKTTSFEDDCLEEIAERPIPLVAGCGAWDEPLRALAGFIDLSPDWITALAAFNVPEAPAEPAAIDWTSALSRLPKAEHDAFLQRFLEEEPTTVQHSLKRRLYGLLPNNSRLAASRPATVVPWGTLYGKFEDIERERERRAQEETQKRERAYYAAIQEHEQRLWEAARAGIETKTTKGYNKAIALLKVLEDLARHRHDLESFSTQVNQLIARFPTLTGMQSRMKSAGLLFPPENTLRVPFDHKKWEQLYSRRVRVLLARSSRIENILRSNMNLPRSRSPLAL